MTKISKKKFKMLQNIPGATTILVDRGFLLSPGGELIYKIDENTAVGVAPRRILGALIAIPKNALFKIPTGPNIAQPIIDVLKECNYTKDGIELVLDFDTESIIGNGFRYSLVEGKFYNSEKLSKLPIGFCERKGKPYYHRGEGLFTVLWPDPSPNGHKFNTVLHYKDTKDFTPLLPEVFFTVFTDVKGLVVQSLGVTKEDILPHTSGVYMYSSTLTVAYDPAKGKFTKMPLPPTGLCQFREGTKMVYRTGPDQGVYVDDILKAIEGLENIKNFRFSFNTRPSQWSRYAEVTRHSVEGKLLRAFNKKGYMLDSVTFRGNMLIGASPYDDHIELFNLSTGEFITNPKVSFESMQRLVEFINDVVKNYDGKSMNDTIFNTIKK